MFVEKRNCDIRDRSNHFMYFSSFFQAAKMYQYDKCTKSYTRYSSLYKHSKTLHDDERPFECEVCQKTFVFRVTLNDHLVSHTDVKSHICPVCGKGYKQRSGMTKHLTVHQDPTYTCEICGKHFDRKTYLRSHLNTHGDKQECLACKASVFHLDKHLCNIYGDRQCRGKL